MKKLMFAMAAVALAVSAQAASTYTATIDFGTDYIGYSVWTVNCWNKGTHSAAEYDYSAPLKGMFDPYKDYTAELAANTKNPDAQIVLLNNYAKGTDKVGDFTRISNNMTELRGITVGDNGTATITSGTGNEMYSWLFVLVSGLDANGNATYGTEYAVVRAHESSTMYSYDETKPQYQQYTYTTGNYTLSGNNIEVTTRGTIAIPEPTSGLLLLLGVAGLALKRRRA